MWSLSYFHICFTLSVSLLVLSSQAHALRKRKRLIDESVARCVTRCLVTQGTDENRNVLLGIELGKEIWPIYS